jgi:hypothetical protein
MAETRDICFDWCGVAGCRCTKIVDHDEERSGPMTKGTATRVVNLYKEPYDVYIGRAGKGQDGYFGNPFPHEDPKVAIESFRQFFNVCMVEDPIYRARVVELRGKRLGCFCKPKPCHGDVIVEWIEANVPKEQDR